MIQLVLVATFDCAVRVWVPILQEDLQLTQSFPEALERNLPFFRYLEEPCGWSGRGDLNPVFLFGVNRLQGGNTGLKRNG